MIGTTAIEETSYLHAELVSNDIVILPPMEARESAKLLKRFNLALRLCRMHPDARALFRDNPSQEEHDLPIKLTFTVQEAADLLGICRSTAYECVHRGDLPALRLGRRLLVTRATLESMLGALPDHRVVASGDADS